MNFTGKVTLVTGASSGIGAEIARHFARLNASLVLVDKSEDALPLVGRECVDAGANVEPVLIPADLTKDEDLSNVVKRTIDRFGRIDVLVNVAGVYITSDFQSSSMEQFDLHHLVNIRAVYQLSLLCTPHLIISKGVIVNVSSCVSKKISTISVCYSLAKVAVDHLTKSLAVELGPKGVRVNAVNPGLIDTPLHDAFGTDKEAILSQATQTIPLRRIGAPSEVAKTVAFLASDDASYITGATLMVDGAHSLS